MSQTRNLATPISIAVAVVCAAWAIYATQHRPEAGGGGPSAGAGARSAAPATVTTAQVRNERLTQKLEALGNARANESVDISSKISNVVTAVRFGDGEDPSLLESLPLRHVDWVVSTLLGIAQQKWLYARYNKEVEPEPAKAAT